jgi:Uma2 family endonuclease
MPMLIREPSVEQKLIDDRRARGLDRWDEVWEGTYVVMTLPNNEHQRLVTRISHVLQGLVDDTDSGQVLAGCNVSDRGHGWDENFRCPDIAVYLTGNPAIDFGAHWQGGPDLAIEIVSPGDASHEKLDFYAAVGTRELLILNRDPWQLELYRAVNGELTPVATDTPLLTTTIGVEWTLAEAGPGAPSLKLVHVDTRREWHVTA